MSCGLVVEELEILNILRMRHSFARNRSFELDHIAKGYCARFNKDPEDIADDLKKKGYITLLSKRVKKYYISDLKATFYALSEHGYIASDEIADGRIRSSRFRKL